MNIKPIDYGGVIWTIEFSKDIDNWGTLDVGQKKILIHPLYDQPWSVIYHELAHLIAEHAELKNLIDDRKVQEVIDNTFGMGFFQLIKHNPHIAGFRGGKK